ncbi:MAG TPA: B12-binding domain-containing protein [Egicoccus sp.]|nr:B12-binding domain-containing protein [Egicoccus sp.]HSK22746.1 B12-binding domain-containing protein [Egicoccus sp.]
MVSTTEVETAPERLLRHAVAGDVDGAFALLDELLADGWSAERVLAEAVIPAQQEVGARWHRNEWSVAREHTSTAVVDALVGVLGLRASYGAHATPHGPPVLVVCAEGEWHTLTARIVAEGLRAQGWPVLLLGGSVPADHLASAAADADWEAAVVCCAVPMFLPGARRSIAALRDEGVPVLATGRAFGEDDRRALAVGADAWAPDLISGVEVLSSWRSSPPKLTSAPARSDEAADLVAESDAIVSRAYADLAQRWPPFAKLKPQAKERTREDFAYLVQFLAAALVADDARIVAEYLEWLTELLERRGVPASVVPLTLQSVEAALPYELTGAHRLLAAARA